jgi:hypothetical protein
MRRKCFFNSERVLSGEFRPEHIERKSQMTSVFLRFFLYPMRGMEGGNRPIEERGEFNSVSGFTELLYNAISL